MTRSFDRSTRNLQDLLKMHSGTTYLNFSQIGRQAAERRRSEIWPLCISVQGHSRSNPSNASDRHTWVSYLHYIQTLAVTLTVCEIIALKVGLFWPSIETRDIWDHRDLNCRRYIFWKLWDPSGKRWKDFSKNFNRFVTASENVRAGVKKWAIFRGFLAVVTWFLDFSQRARFSINRV